MTATELLLWKSLRKDSICITPAYSAMTFNEEQDQKLLSNEMVFLGYRTAEWYPHYSKL